MLKFFGPKVQSKNVIIFGMENAGKTSLMYRTKFAAIDDFVYTNPTCGFNREIISINGKKHVTRMHITDLPGRPDLRTIWSNFINIDVDGLIFALDIERAVENEEYLYDANRPPVENIRRSRMPRHRT